MKKILAIFSIAMVLLGCESQFNPVNQLGEVRLQFPEEDEDCEEGTFLSDSEIRIPFEWEPVENAISYKMEIRDLVTNETLDTSGDITGTETQLVLIPGTLYQWRVIATDGINEKASDFWNFYSSGLATENHVPFPAQIEVTDNSNGTVTIEWEAIDLDDDIVSYTISFGAENPPNTVETNFTGTSYDVNAVSGQTYYLVIRTIDSNENYSDARTAFEF